MKFDYVIVGAGLAGCTMAHLLATEDKKILIIDYRRHIAGNIYDCYNNDGILIHNYGAHLFHTKSKRVWSFLSQFTEWNYYVHKVLAYVDGQNLPFPINISTVNNMFGTNFNSESLQHFFNSNKIHVKDIKNSEEQIISQVGTIIYEKFFKNYTKKQWGVYPSELDRSVTQRIPIRFNMDNRYFTDPYQGIPKNGYTKMVENMINHSNIKVMLNTSFEEIEKSIDYQQLIYTGPIDRYFNYKHGRLPYRSLKFEHSTLDTEKFQEAMVVNYPNDYDFTRIIEFKHCTGQKHHRTTICMEYPSNDGEPYYPVPNNENHVLYKKYQSEADKLKNVIFIGRLAEYKYFDMDMVVSRALILFDNMKKKLQ